MYPTGVFPYNGAVEVLLGAIDQLFRKNRVEESLKELLLRARPEEISVPASELSLDPVELNDLQKLVEDLSDRLRVFGFKGFANAYLNEFSERCGKTHVIERTAEHLRYLPLIHSVFPEARRCFNEPGQAALHRVLFQDLWAGDGV